MSWFWFEVAPGAAPFECQECGDEDYIGVVGKRDGAGLYETLREGAAFVCPACYVKRHLPRTGTFGMILGPDGQGFYEPGAEEVKA